MQVGSYPCKSRAKRLALIWCREQWRLNVLRLTAIAMWRNNHAPGYCSRNLGTIVLAHHVKGEINRGSRSGRGQYLAIIDIESMRIDLYPGIALCQFCCPRPMCRDATTIQQSRGSKEKRSRTERYDASSPLIGPA